MEHNRPYLRLGTYLALAVAVAVMTFPIVWMVLVSFKNPEEASAYPLTWLPKNPTLQNYLQVWQYAHLERYFLNSLIVSGATTLLAIVTAAPAAYGFSRFRYRVGGLLESSFLATQMLPWILLVIPYFVMVRALGLMNTYPALFLMYTAIALPFCTWMLIGFFRSIPRDLDEAALIDGCGWFSAFRLVVLPLAAPGVAATALFAFLVGWKEYMFALVLTSDTNMYVLTTGIAQLFGEIRVEWGEIMAASVIASIPALVCYAFLERYLVQGLTAGAVKG